MMHMLETIQLHMRWVHIAIGASGLLAFWIPLLATKGGRAHVRSGRVFTWICYAVLASAAVAVTLQMIQFWLRGIGPRQAPAIFSLYVFLGYLTVTTFAIVAHGRGAVIAKENTHALRTPWRIAITALAVSGSIGLIAYAIYFKPPTFWVLLAISSFGFFAGYDAFSHMLKSRATTREWIYEHLNGMIGAGIAFYTAFAVFGSRALLDLNALEASWVNVLPWLLPAAIGVPATLYWKRLVMKRFDDRQ